MTVVTGGQSGSCREWMLCLFPEMFRVGGHPSSHILASTWTLHGEGGTMGLDSFLFIFKLCIYQTCNRYLYTINAYTICVLVCVCERVQMCVCVYVHMLMEGLKGLKSLGGIFPECNHIYSNTWVMVLLVPNCAVLLESRETDVGTVLVFWAFHHDLKKIKEKKNRCSSTCL